ncbi:hypothetical protein [Acetobacterium bakii]|uniref:Uncharacterized protein n=1 Tax=Acetobacterium bakii TaxID=52689 RepID=A0A0L6TWF9_9FIRM|nr:hypothetical protein [Acetobacterium bakii]KNZ40598.1 hypothetical protein AKG39_16765 [Acetobacterium bakii]
MNEQLKNIFSKIKSYARKKPYLFIFFTFIVALVIPCILIGFYAIGACGFVIIETSLTVSDALDLYVSWLAFMGTVILGCVAIWQNKNANRISNRLLDLENSKLQPEIYIENNSFSLELIDNYDPNGAKEDTFDVVTHNYAKLQNWCLLTFKIINHSDNTAVDFFLISCKLKNIKLGEEDINCNITKSYHDKILSRQSKVYGIYFDFKDLKHHELFQPNGDNQYLYQMILTYVCENSKKSQTTFNYDIIIYLDTSSNTKNIYQLK